MWRSGRATINGTHDNERRLPLCSEHDRFLDGPFQASNMKILPESFSYESAFSSYREEWEELQKRTRRENITVLDLQWWRPPHDEIDGCDGLLYLIACTDTGEVIVWDMESVTNHSKVEEDAFAGEQERGLEDGQQLVAESKTLLCVPPIRRIKLSNFPLHKVRIYQQSNEGGASKGPETDKSRKRKRPPLVECNTSTTIFVCGKDGIWSLPLTQMSFSGGMFPSQGTDKILDQEHILDVHVHQQKLFAVTSERLFVKDISNLDSRWMQMSFSPHLKNPRKRQTQKQNNREVCTSFLVSNYGSSATTPLVLVGTNQSRVLLLKLEINDISGILSWKEMPTTLDWESRETLSNAAASKGVNLPAATGPVRRFGETTPNRMDSKPSWTITDMKETHSTWWTISASANDMTKSDHVPTIGSSGTQVNRGRIATWHAPSKALVASYETPEAVSSISSLPTDACRSHTSNSDEMLLYSVANNQVVSLWRSPYLLKRMGRLWTTAPSNKAIASVVCGGRRGATTFMAAAGVGNSVDIYADHCRARTLTIKVD
jgi:hypothetical protein